MARATKKSGISPRVLVALVVLVLAAASVGAWFLLRPKPPASVPGVPPHVTTALADMTLQFPVSPLPALKSPQGIVWTGSGLAVAESDGAAIVVFDTSGKQAARLSVPVAPGAPTAYPSDLAMVGSDRVAVVDASGKRVLLMSLSPTATAAPVVFGAGKNGHPPMQPTAVAALGRLVAVADAASHDIKLYDLSGRYVRSIGGKLSPSLTFVGGMLGVKDRLYISDSNAGRAIVLAGETGKLEASLQARMQLPRAVCAGPGGVVFVIDRFGRAVVEFGGDGDLLRTVGSDAISGGSLESPQGIAADPATGALYITDAASGTVKRLELRKGK
jgi:DNA-binding beta-propeller fold protein YncE